MTRNSMSMRSRYWLVCRPSSSALSWFRKHSMAKRPSISLRRGSKIKMWRCSYGLYSWTVTCPSSMGTRLLLKLLSCIVKPIIKGLSYVLLLGMWRMRMFSKRRKQAWILSSPSLLNWIRSSKLLRWFLNELFSEINKPYQNISKLL